MNRASQIMRGLAQPERILRRVIRHLKIGSFESRLNFDAFARPWYAYCMWHAAVVGRRLGLSKLSAMEFGVFGGDGLVEMERLAEQIERELAIEFEIYGFDLGSGLPEHSDYRDLPYIWRRGLYHMDEAKVRAKLKRSELIIGNVRDTAPKFLQKHNPAPIGFVAFDMDYYSSTMDAFCLFEGPHLYFLPRTFCYFDDVIGDDLQLHHEFAGELLAIREFNDGHPLQKLARINGLAAKRYFQSPWSETVYVLHRFDHEQYDTYIRPDGFKF